MHHLSKCYHRWKQSHCGVRTYTCKLPKLHFTLYLSSSKPPSLPRQYRWVRSDILKSNHEVVRALFRGSWHDWGCPWQKPLEPSRFSSNDRAMDLFMCNLPRGGGLGRRRSLLRRASLKDYRRSPDVTLCKKANSSERMVIVGWKSALTET
jgi:hypothetical protein